MRRLLKLALLLGAAVGLYQAAAMANNAPMPTPPSASGVSVAQHSRENSFDLEQTHAIRAICAVRWAANPPHRRQPASLVLNGLRWDIEPGPLASIATSPGLVTATQSEVVTP